jgi:hypothetical protein
MKTITRRTIQGMIIRATCHGGVEFAQLMQGPFATGMNGIVSAGLADARCRIAGWSSEPARPGSVASLFTVPVTLVYACAAFPPRTDIARLLANKHLSSILLVLCVAAMVSVCGVPFACSGWLVVQLAELSPLMKGHHL